MNHFNFLVVIPRYVNKIGDGYIVPLGIAYVSASLKKAGFHVFTLNLNHHEGKIYELIYEKIIADEIDVICVGGMSMHFASIYKIIESAKKIKAEIVSIAGGGIITAGPVEAMTALEFVDYGVIGEGEITICELAKAIETNSNVETIKGIIYKDGSNFKITEPREEIVDLDSLPYPDYDAIELEHYLSLPNNFTNEKYFVVISSRSCPFRCTFCFHTIGNKYRQRSIKSISDEITFLVDKYHIRFFYIADELFGQDKHRVKVFCEFAKHLDFHWRTNFRVSNLDSEMVSLLKKGNCDIVSLGVESADNRILRSMRKMITIKQTERALELLYKSRIIIEGNLIFGDKEETYETAMHSLDWWEQHKKYGLNLLWIQTFPGTFLYQYACEKGIITNPIQYLKDDCPAVNVSKMSDCELAEVAVRIIQLPFGDVKNPLKTHLVSINRDTERITISGICPECLYKNLWSNIKIFSFGDVGMVCKKCGKKHCIRMPDELSDIFVSNVESLLSKYERVGMWGVTYNTFALFKKYPLFKDPRIIMIDSAHAKQQIRLDGKKVYSQVALNEFKIPVLISLYANYSYLINIFCQNYCPSVKKVYDACALACSDSLN